MGSNDFQTIGKYKIIGTLGRGSMGVVYKAQDPEIGRVVAIKTLRKLSTSQFVNQNMALERFRTEARSAGNLRHPNLITIFDASIEGDTPYIVMDYVEGDGLDSILSRFTKLNPDVALYYLKQIAAGIDAAHSQGVIHRDLKPSNMLVDKNDNLYVVDFGVASMNASFAEGGRDTKKEPVMGTPAYMSPEQILNKDLDFRSDLFGLAVVAFELFTGTRPFPGKTFSEVLGNILNARPVSLTSISELPLTLEAEFERALAKNRDERFPSAEAMVDAFAKALGFERIDKPKPVPADAEEAGGGKGPRRTRSMSEWRSIAEVKNLKSAQAEALGDELPERKEKKPPEVKGKFVDEVPDKFAEYVDKKKGKPAPAREKEKKSGGLVQITQTTGSTGDLFKNNAKLIGSLVKALPIIGVVVLAGGILILIVVAVSSWDSGPPAQPAPSVWDVGERETGIDEFVVLDKKEVDQPPAGEVLARLTDRQLLGLIINENTSEEELFSALEEARLRHIPKLVQACWYPLQSASHLVRVQTIKVLGSLKDPKAVPLLLETLGDLDPIVRSATAEALAEIGNLKSVAYIVKQVDREDLPGVRDTLIAAAEKIQGYPLNRRQLRSK